MPGLWTGMEKRRFIKLYTDTKERLFKIFTPAYLGFVMWWAESGLPFYRILVMTRL
jgi:hypothetical protein